MHPLLTHINIGLIADEITPMRPVKRLQLLREINYSTTLDDKMANYFGSADGKNLLFLCCALRHHLQSIAQFLQGSLGQEERFARAAVERSSL